MAIVQAPLIDERAAQILAEARKWIGTPYQHQGRVRGVGVDCIGLIFGVLEGAGVRDKEFWDAIKERYKAYRRVPDGYSLYKGFSAHLPEIPKYLAEPADMLLIRFAKAPRHTAILTDRGTIIHAYSEVACCTEHQWSDYWYRETVTCFRLRAL